ncbi:hypothetical protein [Streptomyces sp. OR43]|uniref:hypothetical protein n=1 Tax=Streptomyces sp. or43 TaxID=2478957 RepID=UPI0021CA8544|nr:hypothetical protein [Streptomyces sp. or43]
MLVPVLVSYAAGAAPDGSPRPGPAPARSATGKLKADYESNGAPRSESATDLLPAGRFEVGDVRRYEFSVLLKDWKS